MMDYVQREVIDLPLIVGFINIIKKEIMENSERIPTPKSMLRDIDIVSEETFWVQALGNAFAPRVRHGDQVLISRAALKSGDLAVIVYPKTNALFLKRYMNYGGRVSLIPENPEDHENIEIASNDIEEQSIVLYKVLRIASIP